MRQIIALLSLVFALEAFACGDSLYRVGKGISYRVYTAPLPGSVLVYGESEGTRQLAEALAQSGHEVRVVPHEVELGLELQKGDYDVVIAAYADHEKVEAGRAAAATGTDYLPVALNRNEAAEAERSYEHVMLAERDEIKHYLKEIHRSLKRRT